MSEINLTGLLYSLPNSEAYEPQYVPVPLTSVKIQAKVVNFITEVSKHYIFHGHDYMKCCLYVLTKL
jgi:hypothetical protein